MLNHAVRSQPPTYLLGRLQEIPMPPRREAIAMIYAQTLQECDLESEPGRRFAIACNISSYTPQFSRASTTVHCDVKTPPQLQPSVCGEKEVCGFKSGGTWCGKTYLPLRARDANRPTLFLSTTVSTSFETLRMSPFSPKSKHSVPLLTQIIPHKATRRLLRGLTWDPCADRDERRSWQFEPVWWTRPLADI